MCTSLPLISGSFLCFLGYTHHLFLLLSPPVTDGEGFSGTDLNLLQRWVGWPSRDEDSLEQGTCQALHVPHRGGKSLGMFRAGGAGLGKGSWVPQGCLFQRRHSL